MCTGPPRGFIVVGVDDRAESVNAVRYAIELARASGLCVRLVHAFGSPVGYGQYGAVDLGRMERTAHALIDMVVTQAGEPEDVCVERVVDSGSPVEALTTAGDDARFVVIGRRAKYRAPRLLRRNVASRLSAKASVPVLTVPAAWRYADHDDRPIVVGLDDAADSHRALAFAFAYAEQSGSRLLVMQAVAAEQDRDHDPTALWQALTHWRARYPRVGVDVQVPHGDTEQVLAQASADASLLVVGKPNEYPGLGSWWSSLPTALVSGAACPVAVVPHTLADTHGTPAYVGDDANAFDTKARS